MAVERLLYIKLIISMQPLTLEMDKFDLIAKEHSSFKKKLFQLRESPPIYKTTFQKGTIPLTLTFNDILMVPQYGQIESRSQCIISSHFSKNIPLNTPIVSSPMDTVTESSMAIQMARQGGLGILHRFMPIEEQCYEIQKVKRSGVFMNPSPVCVSENANYKTVKGLMKKYQISSFLVVGAENVESSPRLGGSLKKIIKGILTQRDINNFKFEDEKVTSFMTGIQKLIYYQVNDSFDPLNCDLNSILANCKSLLISNKIEKIPIITSSKAVVGLVSIKDLKQYESMNQANKDSSGRLFVGAAVGANKDYIERSQALIKSGCDVLVVDVANGHSKLAMNATEELKERFPTIDIVAGSVATGEGAQNLIRSGADGIRCGIGNGSICITRVVAGSGIPQLSALMDTAPVCSYYDIPLCSDGGNKNSGNMCKALAVGADSIMVGRLIAGCEQSPGISFNKDGKFVKIYRGMAGLGANMAKQDKTGGEINPQTFSAQGVEGYIPFIGPLRFVIQNFASGIKSGMSYTGAFNLKELREKVKFVQITNSGFKESNVHGITKFE